MGKIARNLFRKCWLHLPFGCFVIAILCLCFTYGVMVGKWHIFPYRLLDAGFDSLRGLWDKPPRPHHIFPARYEGAGVIVCEREHVCPGVTLLTGYWKDGKDWDVGIRLVDLNGKVLHKWQCDPSDIWEKSPHSDVATGYHDHKLTTYVHGTLLLPNGDVIFNLEHYSLIRINSSSDVIWKLPYRTHHSIFQDDDGNIWICGTKWHEDHIPEFPGLKPPFVDDMVLKISLDGVIEREISLLGVIYKSGYDGLLRHNTEDTLHLNDVEVLSEQKAEAFDLFNAGDIMVSMRNINTVFIVDGKTERIKWSLTYPFIAQHDPDFTEDGYITVFDNNIDRHTPESECGGSRILRVEPSTKEISVLYGRKKNQYFYTAAGGKHQLLPNRNILITEARAGRVFEVTANGKVVWSWITPRWDKNSVSEILEGTRYGTEYADFVSGLRKDEK